MRTRGFVLLTVMVLLAAGMASAQPFYVSKSGNDGDATSWATAKTTIQAGINEAYIWSQGNGGATVEVWVAQGVYADPVGEVWGNVSVSGSIIMKDHVHLYGGFEGDETDRSQRAPTCFVTVIDGSNGRGPGTPAYHTVVFGKSATPTIDSVLDGFRITGGQAAGAGGSDYHTYRGGGIYNWLSSPTIANCTIFQNAAAVSGGGIANESDLTYTAAPSVENCVFYDNGAGRGPDGVGRPIRGGGAVFNNFAGATYTHCTLYANAVANPGYTLFGANSAGMYSWSSQTTVIGTIVYNNAPGGIEHQTTETGTDTTNVTYSCVQAVSGAVAYGASNLPLGTNPNFATTGPTFYLNPASPCVAHVATNPLTNDLTLASRPIGGASDIGAFETLTAAINPVCAAAFSLALDASGQASLGVVDIDAGSTAVGGVRRMEISPSTFGCVDLGVNTVTLTVYDYRCNSNTCTTDVTITDQAPSVTGITYGTPATADTNAATVTWDVTFDEGVSGVATGNFSVTATGGQAGAAITGVSETSGTGTNSVWQVSASTIDDQTGTVQLDLIDGTGIVDLCIQDVTNTLSGPAYNVDRVDLNCTGIVRGTNPGVQTTNAAQVEFDVTFDDDVAGLGTGNFSIVGSGGDSIDSVAGAGTAWTVTVNTASDVEDTLTIDLTDTTGVTDDVGNPLVAGYAGDESYDVDTAGPVATAILRGTNPGVQLTNAAQVEFDVTFNENANGVAAGNFTPAGGAGDSVDSVSGVATAWTVVVNTATGVEGTDNLTVDLDASLSGITDDLGNPMTVARPGDEYYSIDTLGPTVLSITRQNPTPTNATAVDFRATFSEDVSGVAVGNFSPNATGGQTAASVASVSGVTASEWDISVDTASGIGELGIDLNANLSGITDTLGNPMDTPFSSSERYDIDREAPETTAVSAVTSSPTGDTTVVFNVTFTEPVTGFNDSADVIVTATAGLTYNPTVQVVDNGTQDDYNVTLTDVYGAGDISIDVDTGSDVIDLVGNALVASGVAPDVVQVDTEIVFDVPPQDARAYVDDDPFLLTVSLSGGAPPFSGYDWKRVPTEGGAEEVVQSNTDALVVDPALPENLGSWDYWVEVSDTYATASSPEASVQVAEHLQFVQDLPDQVDTVDGETVNLTVEVSGGLGDLTNVWSRDPDSKAWEVIPGATGMTLTFDPVVLEDEMMYMVDISDEGSTVSGTFDTLTDSTMLNVANAVPAAGALGLAALAALTALGGAAAIRRRKQ